MPPKDRLERKKYMGVWRWESELTARMIRRFPNTVIRYMQRKRPNMNGESHGQRTLVALKNPMDRGA